MMNLICLKKKKNELERNFAAYARNCLNEQPDYQAEQKKTEKMYPPPQKIFHGNIALTFI